MKKILLIMLAIFAYTSSSAQTFNYDFSNEKDNWEYISSDYLQLTNDDGSTTITNYFTGIRKKVEGLDPFTNYKVKIDITINTELDEEEIDSEPALFVDLNANLLKFEPKKLTHKNALIINSDKGKKIKCAINPKSIANKEQSEDQGDQTQKIQLSRSHEFEFKTDKNGVAWILISTETKSGDKVDLENVTLDFQREPVLSVEDDMNESMVFPNPSNGVINLKEDIQNIEVWDSNGNHIQSISNPSEVVNLDLTNGRYFLQMKTDDDVHKEMIIINK